MKKPSVKVAIGDPPIKKEILAESIVRIGQEIGALNKSGLNRRAIIILLADLTRVKRDDIAAILDAIPELQARYCK